jgi:outer membrane protein TolC
MFVRFLCLAILVAGLGTPAVAQERSGNPVSLGLSEAIATALARNPALAIERLRVDAALAATEAERGTREPVLNVSQAALRRDNLIASRFYPTGLYIDEENVTRVSLESKTGIGGIVTAGVDYRQLFSTSNIQTLSPQYSANLVFGVSQPLLRDFGVDAAESRIRLADERARVAEQVLVQSAARLISETEQEYWRWTFARQQADVARRSRDAATRLVTEADTLFGAGRIPPATVLQARAALAEREERAIGAASHVDTVEDRLKLLLRMDLTSALTNADRLAVQTAVPDAAAPTFVPASQRQQPGQPRPAMPIDAAASIASALQRRPELIALARERNQRQIELGMARNLMLPRLDLNAQYTRSGMAGLPSRVCVDPTAIECVPAGSDVADSVFASLTSPSDAFSSLIASTPFDGWSAELRLQVPLGMREARARRTEAQLKLAESELRLSAARDEVVKDVRDALRQAATARAKYDAARQIVAYARSQFNSARTQLDAGLASSYDVVRVQDEMDRASLTELEAHMELNIALARVRLADMTVLDDYPLAGAPRGAAGTK